MTNFTQDYMQLYKNIVILFSKDEFLGENADNS